MMRAKIAAWWICRDLRKRLQVARRISEASRQWMAHYIEERARVLTIRTRVDGSLSDAWLEAQLTGDVERRRLALREGANSHTDPRWLRAAILEAWTLILIYEARGALSSKKVLAAKDDIGNTFRLPYHVEEITDRIEEVSRLRACLEDICDQAENAYTDVKEWPEDEWDGGYTAALGRTASVSLKGLGLTDDEVAKRWPNLQSNIAEKNKGRTRQ